nr:hypothetical protein Hi04_10k_c361_00018 [uncultured bacterium]
MSKFKIYNGPMPTTAAQASVATGTAVKTMLQLKASKGLIITGWGYSLDTEQAAAGTVELLQTDVAATVTAFATADIVSVATPSVASSLTKGTSSSGYTGSAEGSITATSVFDAVRLGVSTTYGSDLLYVRTFSKDERPYLPVGKFLRVRVTAGTSAGMICWVSWLEY